MFNGIYSRYRKHNSLEIKKKVIVAFILMIFMNLIFTFESPITMGASNTFDVAGPQFQSSSSTPRSTQRSRNSTSRGFTENSSGLPSSGDYNYIAFGDFNKDGETDIAFGGEDWDIQNTVGLYAYSGNGGNSWTKKSTGLWTGNSWGGLKMVDADEDGNMELYATDEDWGTDNNSGLKVWEYISGGWTDSPSYVTSPLTSGRPCNVLFANVTGDSKLDLIICRFYGVKYYENQGGNPITWKDISTGLPTSNWYTTAAVEDINKDGLKDIVCCRNDKEYLYIQSTTGNLWQQPSTGITVSGYMTGVSIADVNADSHNDLIFGTSTPSNGYGIKVLLGNSGGVSGNSFTWTNANSGLPTTNRYGQVEVVDIDLDGDLDIVGPCATNDNGIEVYLGNGSTNPGMNIGWTKATNTNLTSFGDWYCVNCEDINHDGSLDIMGASWGSGIKVWLSNLSRDMTPPGMVSDLTAINATETSITLNWTAPADNATDNSSGAVTEYDIRCSKSNITPGNWPSRIKCVGEPTPGTPGTNQSFQITGLESATQYFIALRSSDEQPNISPISNIVINTTFGLRDTHIPGQILGMQALNCAHNSINLSWKAPADNGTDQGSGAVTEYDIRYFSEEITNTTWSLASKFVQSMTPKSPGQNEICKVTGLDPEIKYYFSIKSRDERPNWGYISNCANNTTLSIPDIIPPSNIDDLKVIDPSDISLNLSWSAPGDDGDTGSATSYDIRFSTSMITSQNWQSANKISNSLVPKNSGEGEHFEVIGLQPNTNYYFAIKTSDENTLWSGLSNIASGKTLESLDSIRPSQITDLGIKAEALTATNVTLTWSAPGDDDDTGTVSGYDIRYSTEPITDLLFAISTQGYGYPEPLEAGSQQTYIITGLLSGTKYYFAIKAFDEVPNWSILSNVPNCTTASSSDNINPGKITDLTAVTISQNSVKLTWSAPGDDGVFGTVTGYDIRYSDEVISDSTWETALKSVNYLKPQVAGERETFLPSNLFAGKQYYFAIKSYDELPNYSELSNIASATTYYSDDSIKPGKIEDLSVEETTENSAILSWTSPGDDGDIGSATIYDIRYLTEPITSNNWNEADKLPNSPIPKIAGEVETALITGLSSNST